MSGSPVNVSTVGAQIEHIGKDAWITSAGVQLEYDIFSLSTVALQVEYIPPEFIEGNIVTTSNFNSSGCVIEATMISGDIETNSSLVVNGGKGSLSPISSNILTESSFVPAGSKYIIQETDDMTQAVFTDYLEEQFMLHTLKGTPYTPPNSVWIALYTNSPGEDDSGTEVSGDGYYRTEVPRGGWETPSSGATQNLNAINFPTALSDWGTIRYIGIKDAQFSGSLLIYSELKNPKAIDENDEFGIKVGGLDLIIMNSVSHYLGNKFLDYVLNGVSFDTPGSSIYLALYTTAPEATDTLGVEVSKPSYERLNFSNWSVPNEGVCSNLSDIIFSNKDGTYTEEQRTWGIIRGFGVKDASTGGNLLYYGAFGVEKEMTLDDVYKLPTGKCRVGIR
jgi:hypothetical protein